MCGMTRPPVSLAQRLKIARKAREMSQLELAKFSNMKQPDISKIELSKILQTTGIARLADALGVPVRWLELGEGPEPEFLPAQPLTRVNYPKGDKNSPPPKAHVMSPLGRIVATTTIAWGDLMSGKLPEVFALIVQDDAMAPLLNMGNVARFSTKSAPSPGKRVLVADKDENTYIREYRFRRGTHWQAVALNDAYDDLDSISDGLRVLAVLIGVDWE